MNRPPVVLDSGVLAQATADKDFRETMRNVVGDGRKPLIPTVVLAEAITGRPRDAATNQTIKRYQTVDTHQPVARRAGILRHRALRSGVRIPSAIDAIVAAHAVDARADTVFTTDPDDLQRLLADHPWIHVEKP